MARRCRRQPREGISALLCLGLYVLVVTAFSEAAFLTAPSRSSFSTKTLHFPKLGADIAQQGRGLRCGRIESSISGQNRDALFPGNTFHQHTRAHCLFVRCTRLVLQSGGSNEQVGHNIHSRSVVSSKNWHRHGTKQRPASNAILAAHSLSGADDEPSVDEDDRAAGGSLSRLEQPGTKRRVFKLLFKRMALPFPVLRARFAKRFIKLLFKGMTLPFPMLRALGNAVGDEEDEERHMGLSLRECALAILGYLGLGTMAYSFCLGERWSLVDAVYFSVVTCTSVGYGDCVPSTVAGKAFTCLFGFSGLAFLGVALSTIGSSLLKVEEDTVKAAEAASRDRVKRVFEGMPSVVQKLRTSQTTSADHQENEVKEELDTRTDKKASSGLFRMVVSNLLPALAFLFFGGVFMGKLEGWSWGDSLYFSLITAGTLGYGDFSPQSTRGRMWAVFFIPLAVASAGELLGNIASSLILRRQAKLFHSLTEREITIENLLVMDANNDGKVSREEYVQFMLIEMGLVEAKEFEELHSQFDRLDVDGGGFLDQEDLRLMTELRGKGKQ